MKTNHSHPFRSPTAKETFLARYDALAEKWPVPSETTTIATSYGQTFVRISGPAEAAPLVLLHGHSENSLNWMPNIEGLSQTYRTYAVDTISDPGRSVCTRLMKSAGDYTTWLDELFEGLGLAQGINLIGLSYGGWLTSQYALRFPQRLGKIVLMAPPAIAPFPVKFIILAMFLSLFQYQIKFLFKRFNRWMFKRLTRQMFQDFIAMHENGKEKFDEWFDFLYLGIQSYKVQPIVFARLLTDEELRQLTLPTLFLTGENEIIYSVADAIQRLREVAPHIQTKTIANAGHDLPIAQPQAVNLAILDFLQG